MDEEPHQLPLEYHKDYKSSPRTAWADEVHLWGPGAVFCGIGLFLLVGAYVAYGSRSVGLAITFVLSIPCFTVGALFLAVWQRVERQKRSRRPR